MKLDVLSMGGIGVLAMVGPTLVDLLWDDRYADAGWMLRVLCVRAATRAVFQPADTCLVAMGHTKFSFLNNVARTVMLYAGIPIGWHLGGVAGVIWAVAISDLPGVFILWPKLRAEGVFRVEREALSWIYFAVGLGLGYGLVQMYGWIV